MRWVRPFDWESSSANIQTIADTIEAEQREAARMNALGAEKAHYEVGGFVQLSWRGAQHLVTGIRRNQVTGGWLYALDHHDLWIPEGALDLVAAEYGNERLDQAPVAPTDAPSPDLQKETAAERTARRRNEFVSRVCSAINCSSLENGSDTADYIIANFLADVLTAYDSALQQREKWYGRTISGLK